MAVQGSVLQRLDLPAVTQALKFHLGVTSFFDQPTQHRTPKHLLRNKTHYAFITVKDTLRAYYCRSHPTCVLP